MGKWGHPANPPFERPSVGPLEADFRAIKSGGPWVSPHTKGFPVSGRSKLGVPVCPESPVRVPW